MTIFKKMIFMRGSPCGPLLKFRWISALAEKNENLSHFNMDYVFLTQSEGGGGGRKETI